MKYHESELIKIKKSISGFFKNSARYEVATELHTFHQNIEKVESLSKGLQRKGILECIDHAQAMRHQALRDGARSYGHPAWAAAAACESWGHLWLSRHDGNIGDAEYSRSLALVDDLIRNY